MPRRLILAVLAEAGTHLSPMEIHRRVALRRPELQASTVYRNAATLTRHGLLHSFDHAGLTLIGLSGHPHHHLVCDICGGITDIPSSDLAAALDGLPLPGGFQLSGNAQLLRGACGRCRQDRIAIHDLKAGV
ncbi:Fur family transcriptional regulator [Sphaerisporangium fuscum]|uniref:Fur family transcriptional regulator n=1 Tax=Sphaerisporangium fuscum TaxID=2835868 RepID=UPI001BDC2897|nr:transcriptional repressor [Sphaerisporangium fuscum]